MKSLFFRIFLSFWAALLLFILLSSLVTIALNSSRRGIESQGPELLAEAVNAFNSGGEQAERNFLEGVRNEHHVRLYVFDPNGRELAGRHAPPWIEETRRGVPTKGAWMDPLFPGRLRRMALTLDGNRYTLVMELAPGIGVFGRHDVPGLWLVIAVTSSGLICYLLARSLTRPVTRLRRAAQSLAAGDLSARTGARQDGGPGGEIVELMRDFDRMAERLETLVESQSRLLKDVSHELRSPLARLSVALGLARQQAAPALDGQLDRIEREADRLNQLIQRLLTISRLESGTEGIHKQWLPLRELVEQVATDAEFETVGRSCQVLAEADDDFAVEGDAELLRSAVENVVRNAARYTPEGTTVDVRMERELGAREEEIVIRVSDFGPGVPNEALKRIFEPFYRLDDARNRQTGGAGLGLSIADRAIKLHGGQLRASNRKGGGLEVEMRIPAAPGIPTDRAKTGRDGDPGIPPPRAKSGRDGDPGIALPAHS